MRVPGLRAAGRDAGRCGVLTGSLCTGYGGLDMAVHEVLGGELAWVADIDPGASAILAHRFPSVPNLGDISKTDWSAIGPVDVLTAGFPCFPAGTLVDAGEDGLRAIETLRVGDQVLTHNRRRRAVTSVMRRDAEDVLLVKAMGAPAFRVTAEHPFYIRRLISGRVRSWSAPEWVQAGQLDKNCFLSMPLDDPGADPVLGVALAYVVGRWLGDGWIVDHPRRGRANSWMRKAIICCAADEDAELAAAIRAAGLHATRSPERTVTKFHITSADLVKLLRPFGRGAEGKRIPGWVFTAPIAEQEAILRGWLDADGSQQASGQWRATTISERLAHGMARIARTVHGVATSVHRFDVAARTTIEGRNVGQNPQFQVAIPPRNRESFIADGYAWVPIRSVNAAEPCEVFNVSVDEDESYVAHGYAVHNCQDVSCAGGRAGLRDGNRTGVWAHVARAIGELRPSLVVLENVRGLLSAGADSDVEPCPWCLGEAGNEHSLRALGAVLGDLADLGYDARWRVVSAADAGAPHRRERVFIVAGPAADAADSGRNALNDGGESRAHGPESIGRRTGLAGDDRGSRLTPADAERDRLEGRGTATRASEGRASAASVGRGSSDSGPAPEDADCTAGGERWLAAPVQAAGGRSRTDAGGSGGVRAPADAPGNGRNQGGPESARLVRGPDAAERGNGIASDAASQRYGNAGTPGERGVSSTALASALAYADGGGRGTPEPEDAARQPDIDWGTYAPAIARWEFATGRPAPRPTEPGRTGERLSPRFVEWMMGLPEGWVTDAPGLSRNSQLKALGNGVVPAQAAMALRMLLERAGIAPFVAAEGAA
jgi:DNA (cytosine-5)-methyltransferase 1